MPAKSIERTGSLLGLIILAAVVGYSRSDRITVEGSLFLVLASCLCLFSMLLTASLRVRRDRDIAVPSSWAKRTRAYVLLLTAWQSTAVGLFNIWAVNYSRNLVFFALSYLFTVAFVVCCFFVVRFADSPEQEGGSIPINYFGRPRARILFFYGLCYVLLPIFVVGLRVFFLPKPSPAPFQPPQVGLCLACIFSLASTGMVIQRYRRASSNSALAKRVVLLTVGVLASMGAIEIIFSYGTYLFVLSSIIVVCMATTFYRLLLAKEGPRLSAAQDKPGNMTGFAPLGPKV
jgi:hypothetical protein